MFSIHIDTARTWRGGQSQVKYTVLGLRELGHRAALVAHPEGELLRRMSEGLDLVPLAPRSEVDLAAAWRLSRVIRQWRPQVIHAHDPHATAMAALALAIAAPAPRPPLVASRRIEFRIARNSFSRWKYSQVDGFLAIIHEGVDVDRIAATPARSVHAELFLPTRSPVVGTIGALVPQKAQHTLVEAAALVVRRVPDVRVVILGDGELRGALEEQIRHLHLERHVFLAGFRPDAIELLKDFDVFALSSVHEGMCTSLVDAMAASKPAVATVKDEPLRRRMGEAGLERARRLFTVARMVRETADAYEQLVATSGRGGARGAATGE
jgi:glycosyltransferase involved in cell wall biosynthesis